MTAVKEFSIILPASRFWRMRGVTFTNDPSVIFWTAGTVSPDSEDAYIRASEYSLNIRTLFRKTLNVARG